MKTRIFGINDIDLTTMKGARLHADITNGLVMGDDTHHYRVAIEDDYAEMADAYAEEIYVFKEQVKSVRTIFVTPVFSKQSRTA